MEHGKDQDAVRRFLVEDDVRAAFVPTDAGGDRFRLAPHLRIVGQKPEHVSRPAA